MHHSGVAQKTSVPILYRPTRNSLFDPSTAIAVELGIALCGIDRTILIRHHNRVSMHGRESRSVLFTPENQPQITSFDHEQDIDARTVCFPP